MAERRRIRDYAFLSDCHSAALVREGRIEWLCFPRFDSPSVFASILDQDRGGCFAVEPVGDFRCSRAYEPGTNVLITHFQGADGALEILDCLPLRSGADRPGHDPQPSHALVRRLRCTAGRVSVDVTCDPRPNYGQATPRVERHEGRWLFGWGEQRLVLDSEAALSNTTGAGLRARVSLSAGEELSLVLQYAGGSGPLPEPLDIDATISATHAFWRAWSGRLQYDGPYREQVLRSALVLKGLMYEPTGAIVAAPSTSLPEWYGGSRNWDYRYTWLRDSTLTLYALERIGFAEDAHAYRRWVERAASGHARDLRIAFSIDGEHVPPERCLDDLRGFRDSRPVRVGNAARTQRQLDIFGELLDVAFFGHKHVDTLDADYWSFLSGVADFVCDHWREPDHGIWEMRTAPQHYVYSKVLCWVCLDRAERIARAHNLTTADSQVKHWRREMEAIHEDVLRHGYNSSVGAFVQSYGSTHLDASNLALPVLGFIDARDPRMASTIRLTDERLRKHGLVRRYLGVDDGIGGDEGAFLICSFWLVDALILLGEHEKARAYFEELLMHANDVGLLSEEFDAEQEEMLGNFPQAFSHLALITSAVNLAGGAPNRRHQA
jgi:GH15 family glucan-1,4-alpha-glucosidase